MTQPTIVAGATNAVERAFNWRNLLYMTLISILVVLIMSWVMKNEITLVDNQGNVIGKGEVKPKLKVKISKTN